MSSALPPAQPVRTTRPARTGLSRSTILLIVFFIVLGMVLRACFAHKSDYEKIAAGVTQALQNNDIAAVEKYQNAETATEVNRARVGHASDVLAPLGKLETVKETSVDNDTRIHQFDLKFEHGEVHETIKFDPAEKIVAFRYVPVTPAK
jgi:preprotein translocase subunit SecG